MKKKAITDFTVKCPECAKSTTVLHAPSSDMDGFVKPGCAHGVLLLAGAFMPAKQATDRVEKLFRYWRVLELERKLKRKKPAR